MSAKRCAACGKPIVLVHDPRSGPVSLAMMWVHVSRWTRHAAIPPERIR